jgi:hypothetical protein
VRALLSGELAQAQSYSSDYHIRLEVQNGSGTWIDVGAALGRKWIVNASWGETVDSKVMQATFTLWPEMGGNSLSPLMTASVLNRDDLGAYAPLLNIGRLVRASVATMPHLVPLDVAKYRKFFDGRIDNVQQADSLEGVGPITIPCSDLGGWLMDLQIESSGIQYGTTPVGTALETVLQNVITANIPVGEPAVTLFKQSTSNFAVTNWAQGDTKLLDALSTLVLDSTGEDIRYRYDAAHVSRLTWFNPDRARVTVDATFAPGYTLRSLDVALANIRNAGEMPYVGGKAAATSPGSILNFRRRFFRLPASDMVTTAGDAQKVIDAVVNDLGFPPGEAAAEIPFFWPVQLYDRYTFAANSRQYDTDQTFAVMGYQHTIAHGQGSTTLTLTARIVGAFSEWLTRLALPPEVPQLVDFDWSDTPTARTFVWTRNAATAAIWVYDTLVAVGGGSGWPVEGQVPNGNPAVLTTGTDSYVATIPPAGFQRFVQMEPRTDRGVVGNIRRSVVDAAPLGLMYNQTVAQITATTATTIAVTVTATATSGSPTVQLVAVTGSATLLSGPAIGVASPSGTVWVFTRGAALGGSGQAQFRAIAADNVSDDDLVEIPEQGRDTVYLASRARVTATTATTVTARYAVADPYPPGGASVTVTYQDAGSGGVSPASGGTITPAATLTEAAGTFIDYTITRPAFAVGTARVTFTASAANRVTDSDAVDVPALDRDTVELLCRAKVQSTSATQVVARIAVADPVSGGSGNVTVTYTGVGVGTIAPASPQTLTSAGITSDIDTTATVDITIDRAAFLAGMGRVTFTATRTGRAPSTDSVDVPSKDRDTQSVSVRLLRVSETATQIVVRLEAITPNAGDTCTVAYDAAGLTVSPSSGGTFTSTTSFGTTAHIDYTITKDTRGGSPRRVAFTVSAPGYIDGTDGVDVTPVASLDRAKMHIGGGPQTIANNTPTRLDFDVEDFDVGAGIADTTSDRITIPADHLGLWVLHLTVRWDTSAVGYRKARLQDSSGSVVGESIVPGAPTIDTQQHLWAFVNDPAAGEWYESFVQQTSGGNLNANNNQPQTAVEAFRIW